MAKYVKAGVDIGPLGDARIGVELITHGEVIRSARVRHQRTIDVLLDNGTISAEQYDAAVRWWRLFEAGGFWLYAQMNLDSQGGGGKEITERQAVARTDYLLAGAAIRGMAEQIIARNIVCFDDSIYSAAKHIRRRRTDVRDMLQTALSDLAKYYYEKSTCTGRA